MEMGSIAAGVGRRARLAALGMGGAAAALAAAALLPQEVAWSEAEAAPVASAPVLSVSAAALADAAVTVGGEPVAARREVTAPGVVRAGEEAVIASRMTALITSLPYRAGQGFPRGALLAGFDCERMRAELAAAEAAASALRQSHDTNVELDRYQAIGTKEVSLSRAKLGEASAQARAIGAGLDQCAIRAPFAGTVVERIAHPHDVAQAGAPLLKIQGAGALEVELIAPSAWLRWLRPGAPFTFQVEETGGELAGRVSRLGAAVDPVSKTIRVTGSVEVEGAVLPGMSGVARFAEGSGDDRAL